MLLRCKQVATLAAAPGAACGLRAKGQNGEPTTPERAAARGSAAREKTENPCLGLLLTPMTDTSQRLLLPHHQPVRSWCCVGTRCSKTKCVISRGSPGPRLRPGEATSQSVGWGGECRYSVVICLRRDAAVLTVCRLLQARRSGSAGAAGSGSGGDGADTMFVIDRKVLCSCARAASAAGTATRYAAPGRCARAPDRPSDILVLCPRPRYPLCPLYPLHPPGPRARVMDLTQCDRCVPTPPPLVCAGAHGAGPGCGARMRTTRR
ncbi:unnamed protein product [Chrysodeixis includens]|uniref:Uncharacterized protein n=1 Tax=Chrysodeixis includens TaxID=689277 RepID=A0A9N8KSP3_CHRIL|nr:unnamed protein product [Chrysodeixis includens]